MSIVSPNTPRWFALPGIQETQNVFFAARATLRTKDVSPSLPLKICAESWYRLWCNGIEVTTGPARGTRQLAFYDTLELALHLQKGENLLEVLVGCPNFPTFKTAPLRPALWAEIEGYQLTWQVARDESFASQTSLFNFQTGMCEWRDLRVQKANWQEPEYFTLDKQLQPRDCAPLAVSTHVPQSAIFPCTVDADCWQVFDFGQEIIGGAQVEIEALSGTRIELGYGEYLRDGRLPVHLPNEVHTYADCFTLRDGRQVAGPTLQERGFRYLQITADAPATILAIHAIDRRHPLPAPQFQCGDEAFNRLFHMAHHTLSSCATDVLTDCPWREQALWFNDTVVSGTYWLEAGGDPALIARNIRLVLSERNADGLIHGVVPNGKREEIVFLATNAFLALVLKELSRYDTHAATELLEPVTEVFTALQQFSDADGLLLSPQQYWNFIDWSFEFAGWKPEGRPQAAANWFYVLGLDALADLHRQAGKPHLQWQQQADSVARALQARFWDESAQYYREFEDEEKASELSQALACLANRDAKRTRTLSVLLAEDTDTLLKPELYLMHFVLRTLIENGHHEAAKKRLQRYWGNMLEGDSPTIWEANVHQHGKNAFEGAGSLCHAFSCAPLWVLPRLYPQPSNSSRE